MTSRDLFDRIAKLPKPMPGVAQVPPPELVAFTIRCARGLRSWKKSTLADFAGVSLSTVERAERGEVVLPDSLDRMAEALGYEAGYFTAPRAPLSEDELIASMKNTYGEMVPVEIAPLRTETQIRTLIRCHAYLPHCPDIPEGFEADVHGLVEWLDFAAFATTDFAGLPRERARRKLYRDILDFVHDMEKRGLNVLAGIMDAPQARFPDWKVAVLAVSAKAKDPGAAKRKHLFVDRRVVAFRDAA